MKKRKAKRKPINEIDLKASINIEELEEMQELALLNLIAKNIVDATLRELYDDKSHNENAIN